MKYLILITLILFVSCKKTNQEIIETYPIEVRQNVIDFINDGQVYGKVINLRNLKKINLRGKNPENWAGYYYDNQITIDTTSYKWKFHQKFVMYHELGHALLGRGDNDTENESIMNGLPSYWEINQDYFIKELFSNTSNVN